MPPWAPTDWSSIRVGEVNAVAAPAEQNLAIGLAERVGSLTEWVGLGRVDLGEITIIVVRGDGPFRRISRGRVPAWSAGVAMPDRRTIIVRADRGDPVQILRHELAHLALHSVIKGRVPLWFDEGYAVIASGEFGASETFGLNLMVALGRSPQSLDEVSAALRGVEVSARDAYQLAASAVFFSFREGDNSMSEGLLGRLARGEPFDSAVARSTGLDPGRFEDAWLADLKKRYSLLGWLVQGGIWALGSAVIAIAYFARKRRDRKRRLLLDEGWVIPAEEPAEDPAEETAGAKGSALTGTSPDNIL